MALTWQDVAGRVEAPDLSGASAMITRGLQGIGAAVQEPEQRRQAQLVREMAGLESLSQTTARIADTMDRRDTKQKAEAEKKAMKDFGAVQSILEASSRNLGITGGKYEDIYKTDAYMGLSEDARAYAQSRLSDSYLRGEETRWTREEANSDDAYRLERDRVQDGQWSRSFREQQIANADARRDRAAARAAAAYGKPEIWDTGNKITDRTMQQMARLAGDAYIEASGDAYDEREVSEVGKNYKNLSAATDLYNDFNRSRKASEKLPLNAFKRILDTNVGNGSFFDGANNIDDKALKAQLKAAGDQWDTARQGKRYYEKLAGHVKVNASPKWELTEKVAIEGWNKVFADKDKRKDNSASSAGPRANQSQPTEVAPAAPMDANTTRLVAMAAAAEQRRKEAEVERIAQAAKMREYVENMQASAPVQVVAPPPVTVDDLMNFRDANK